MTLDIENASSKEETEAVKQNARERLRLWQKKALYSKMAGVTAAAFLIYPVLLVGSCSRSKPAPPQSSNQASLQSKPVRADNSAKCLQEARKELGPSGTVLKCGYLIDNASLEAIIAVRVAGLSDDRNGIPISALKIVRESGDHWDTQLNVDREVTNGIGYIGTNFIDDSYPLPDYRVNFTDCGAKWGTRSASQLTMVLVSMSRDGKIDPEDMGMAIGWNSAVSRFQEIEPSGEMFAPEVKAPKHISSH